MEQNKKILFDLPDLAFVTGLPDKVANAYRQLMDVWQPGESRLFVWVSPRGLHNTCPSGFLVRHWATATRQIDGFLRRAVYGNSSNHRRGPLPFGGWMISSPRHSRRPARFTD
jgi:hypothetical protein